MPFHIWLTPTGSVLRSDGKLTLRERSLARRIRIRWFHIVKYMRRHHPERLEQKPG